MGQDQDHPCWVIEWTYSPPNFFEEPIDLTHESCEELRIADGKITATIKTECGDPRPGVRDQLHRKLNDRFMGAQLTQRKAYELSRPSVEYRRVDGTKRICLDALPMQMEMVLEADLRITNKDGDVVHDSRKERVEKTERLGTLAAKYGSDPVAEKILKSHQTFINDPANSLAPLYDILEAVRTRFGGEKNACEVLGLNGRRVEQLRKLANDPTLKQGRHPGKELSELRDATEAELKLARDIAREMIGAYFAYLEGNAE